MAERKRKTLAIPDDVHAAWTAAATDEGLSLIAYVTRAVELVRTGVRTREPQVVSRDQARGSRVKPADCTNRLRPGTWCRICSTIHTKGS